METSSLTVIFAVERLTSVNASIVAKSALSSVIDVRVILPVVSVLRSSTLVLSTESVTLIAAASISTSAVLISLINWILAYSSSTLCRVTLPPVNPFKVTA